MNRKILIEFAWGMLVIAWLAAVTSGILNTPVYSIPKNKNKIVILIIVISILAMIFGILSMY